MRILILSMVLGTGCATICCLYLAVPLCANKFPIITEFKNDPETTIQITAMKMRNRAVSLKIKIDFSLDKIFLAYLNLKD